MGMGLSSMAKLATSGPMGRGYFIFIPCLEICLIGKEALGLEKAR